MKLASKTHRLLEGFFREFFGDDKLSLPEIEIYAGRGARLFTKILKVHGITFGSVIFIKPDLMRRNDGRRLCIPKELLAHEATHVLQYQKSGFFKFLYTYLRHYFTGLTRQKRWDFNSRAMAYLQIPHEVEARRCGSKFVEWLGTVKN